MRVLGLFDHAGVRRRQNELPPDQQVSGPYCVQFLMDEGIDLMPVPPAGTRPHRKLRDVVEHRSGIRADLAIRGMPGAVRADVVLCMLEDKAVFPALLRRRGVPPYSRTTLAVVSCWWAQEIESGTDADRARIARTTDSVDLIFAFSKNQAATFEKIGAGEKVMPVTFGVDEMWYTPPAVESSSRRFQCVAMGIDRGRDFESLVAAAWLFPEIRLDIFTQPGRIDPTTIPRNVSLHPPTSMEGHRDNLRNADLVVIPTHDIAYPSGQSVLLEAMSCGRCVAITRTEALDEYIDDGVTNLALPLHDPVGIARVIRRATGDDDLRTRIGRAARDTVVSRYSFRHTWHEVAQGLQALV